MKSLNQLFKKALVLPLICISVLSFSQPELNESAGDKNAENGSIEFVKLENDMLVFKVSLSQIPARGCQLQITNENGDMIFEKKINSSSFEQIYRIERNNISKLNFAATGKNFRFSESFNLRFKVEEKIEVSKL
ncbi:MAG: hypothetical protein H7X88_05420 [Gloeobacteraceae cyanobacterium ES-bin-316]|nr:hypothetical protein [Ferruginibacter sp.]